MGQELQTDVSIDAPELLTGRQRARDAFATALLWGVYVYLWVPLLSLAAWWLGFEFAYDVMVRAGGSSSLRDILAHYSVAVGLIFATVTVWSLSNRMRFRHANRRRVASPVPDQEIASHFGVDCATLTELRAARRINIKFDAEGRLVLPPGRSSGASDAAPTPQMPRQAC